MDDPKPPCAEKDPLTCSTMDWPIPKPLTTPLFPEQHKDVHDYVPARCWDEVTGAFLDRCNPMIKNKIAKEADKKSASPPIPPLVIPEEANDRAMPESKQNSAQ